MSITQNLSYSKIKESYESLDNKKRLLTIIISMASVILLWFLFFMLPLQKKSSLVNTNARIDLNTQIKTAQNTIIKLIQANQSPEESEKKSHVLFYDQLQKLYAENKVESNVDNIIKTLLNNRFGLELNDFQSSEMPIPEKFASTNSPFKPYNINLSFNGSFLQMASYLKQFENPEFPLYFKNISFGLTQYPVGKLTIHILTIVAEKKLPEDEATKP
jgi:hypothetical protein